MGADSWSLALVRLRWENVKFVASLGYIVMSHSYSSNTWEAKAGEL